MRVNLCPQNKNKISLAGFANNTVMSFNQIPLPSLPNHISVSQDCQSWLSPVQNNEFKTQSKPQRKRRKIFQHYHTPTIGRDKVREYQRSQQNTQRQEKVLRKVKTNVTFDTLPLQQSKLEKRIEEINKVLESHRVGRSFHLNDDLLKHNKSQQKEKITKTEEKLYETTKSIKNQQGMVGTKIPSFEKKIEDNNKARNSMSHLLKQKIQQDNYNIQNLMQMINKSEHILKSKEQQLGRINSELLHKETELIHNKQMSKKRELQLIRMKRIEDLQNQNLELYQQLERSHGVSRFQDFVDQEWHEEVKTSGLQIEQQSTIKHKETGLNASVSANNTIGEILSPLALALNEQQYI